MKRKLSEQDRKAVDLLLENDARSNSSHGMMIVPHATGSLKPHVDAAERVFKLLDCLPVEEPPTDLISKTFARISQAVGTRIDAPSDRADQRPHA